MPSPRHISAAIQQARAVSEAAPAQPRYREGRILGKGTFGIVRRARDTVTGEIVVVKRCALDEDGEDVRETVLQEVRLQQQLHHPHICRVLDAWEDGAERELCLVLPYFACGDLRQRLKSQVVALPFEEVVAIGAQLCLALQYVHARGILHRDVKPANVLLADDGSCRLADFGVSRRLASTAALATTCVGTPSFMAPELHADQPYASAADVWALGCVLHECLTLKPAFAAPSAAALGILIRRGTRASALPADTPAPLRRLIDSMLTHDASRRPDAADLLRLEPLRPMLSQLRRSASSRAPAAAAAAAPAASPAARVTPLPAAPAASPPATPTEEATVRHHHAPQPAASPAARTPPINTAAAARMAARRERRRVAAAAQRADVAEYLEKTRARAGSAYGL